MVSFLSTILVALTRVHRERDESRLQPWSCSLGIRPADGGRAADLESSHRARYADFVIGGEEGRRRWEFNDVVEAKQMEEWASQEIAQRTKRS